MATLLVDPPLDSLMAHTMDITKVLHNLEIIGVPYRNAFINELDKQSEKGMVQILACSRYMTVISMSKDKKKGSMHFVDCLNDDNRALDTANVLASFTKDPTLISDFMEEYNKMKPYYELN